ncbi:polyketide cyclase/dehydrase/lipid transport protein [Stackebrandtia albiflava]|uniref:Polyketide cyclase/dehydrase/lipid transport protein n=1 Tax=Stackebrandtia albiflava TaxID=406432 RepID=A0A562VCI4_9ACTN|nr:SRPBCC family protein [Stackebrandtia albiflava]TWJ15589.1 polyketide cyclase/dehydrase/lipid transport protein [Stackebrandtia albiflava]
MNRVYEKSVEVDVPVSTAYNQWTQFESFPYFMTGVEAVTQINDTRTHWTTEIAGVTREFDAEIDEQLPDRKVSWHAVDGPDHTGEVTFEPLDAWRTRVNLRMAFAPEGVTEKAGAATGLVGGRIEGDLDRFKDFIESRGAETGAWRGRVEPGGMTPPI